MRSSFLGFRSNLKGHKKDKKAKYFYNQSYFGVLQGWFTLNWAGFGKKNLLLNSFSGPLLQFFKTFSKGMIPGTKEEFIELDSGPLLLFHSVQLLQPKIMTLAAK